MGKTVTLLAQSRIARLVYGMTADGVDPEN